MLQIYAARFQGGGFNAETDAGFAEWLRRYPDRQAVRAAGLEGFSGSYRDYLVRRYQVRDTDDYMRRFKDFPSNVLWQRYIRSDVDAYFTALRKELHEHAPQAVALSMNVSARWPDATFHSFFLTAYADYLMAETDIDDSSDLIAQVATARALRLGYVPSIHPLDLARNRVAIAMFYAQGAQPLVPWDIFVKDKPRYFGSVEEYGDLYEFVRRHAGLFDDHEAVAMVAIVVDPEQFPAGTVKPLVQTLAKTNIPYAFELVRDAKGVRPLNRERLSGYALILQGIPDTGMTSSDRALLASLGAGRLGAGTAGAAQLDGLQPVRIEPDNPAIRLFLRAGTGKAAGTWVVHVIDESQGNLQFAAPEDACPKRIGIRTDLSGMPDSPVAYWIHGDSRTPVQAEKVSDGYRYYPVRGCTLWGVLELGGRGA